MTDQLRTIVEQMRALGFDWRASFKIGGGMKFNASFSEHADRPDRIAQSARGTTIVEASEKAASMTMAFIAMVGEGWHERPIKE